MREMLVAQEDVFYYLTLMNASYAQPDLPAGASEGVIRGAYRLATYGQGPAQVTLMGSGAILIEVIEAAQTLAAQGIACEVISVTSWSELARDGMRSDACELHSKPAKKPYLRSLLASGRGPVVATTDYVRAVPEQVRAYVPPGRSFTTLGTDGFGRSDTRAALRAYFEVDAASVVRAARHALTTLKIS
jgi:pyruvate dehydrogenase E1 component